MTERASASRGRPPRFESGARLLVLTLTLTCALLAGCVPLARPARTPSISTGGITPVAEPAAGGYSATAPSA
ncbi:MAG TPA: hypothetical protein VGA61_22490, partial [Anaerolineae bacterium]